MRICCISVIFIILELYAMYIRCGHSIHSRDLHLARRHNLRSIYGVRRLHRSIASGVSSIRTTPSPPHPKRALPTRRPLHPARRRPPLARATHRTLLYANAHLLNVTYFVYCDVPIINSSLLGVYIATLYLNRALPPRTSFACPMRGPTGSSRERSRRLPTRRRRRGRRRSSRRRIQRSRYSRGATARSWLRGLECIRAVGPTRRYTPKNSQVPL